MNSFLKTILIHKLVFSLSIIFTTAQAANSILDLPFHHLPQAAELNQLQQHPYRCVGLLKFRSAGVEYDFSGCVAGNPRVLITCSHNIFNLGNACKERLGSTRFYTGVQAHELNKENLEERRGVYVRKYFYYTGERGLAELCLQAHESSDNKSQSLKNMDVACGIAYEDFTPEGSFVTVCACPTAPKTLTSSEAPKWTAGFMDLSELLCPSADKQKSSENLRPMLISLETSRAFTPSSGFSHILRMSTPIRELKDPSAAPHLFSTTISHGAPIFIKSETGEVKIAGIIISSDNNVTEGCQNSINTEDITVNTEIYMLNPAFKKELLLPAIEAVKNILPMEKVLAVDNTVLTEEGHAIQCH